MGNCQAAEAAVVVVQHPGGKVDRLCWSVSAAEVMNMNPGHYVAVVIAPPRPPPPSSSSSPSPSTTAPSSSGKTSAKGRTQRHLRLLRPDDTLHIGHVYRLVSFEEVLKEIAAKKNVKLSRLVMSSSQQREDEDKGDNRSRERPGEGKRREGGGGKSRSETRTSATGEAAEEGRRRESTALEEEQRSVDGDSGLAQRMWMGRRRYGQWRPVLQTIAEVGN